MQKKYLIFTDIDATLLDHDTYEWRAAEKTIKLLNKNKIPIIPVTSKTKSEIIYYRDLMEIKDSFVVENGGAAYIPTRYKNKLEIKELIFEGKFIKKEFGVKIEKLEKFLVDFSNKEDVEIINIMNLPVEKISDMLDLPRELAKRVIEREYDVPFLINNADNNKIMSLKEEAHEKGYKILEGGRLFHISSGYDKGTAVNFLKEIYKSIIGSYISIGLGDSQNDLELLKNVDMPVLIRKKDMNWSQEVLSKVDNIKLSEKPAPYGWKEMLDKILNLDYSKI